MNASTKLLLVVAAAIFTLSPSLSWGTSASVGGVRLSLPAPDGLTDVLSPLPEARQVFEPFVPPQNRLLAFYATPDLVRSWQAGRDADMSRYANVQVFRESERMNLSRAEFQRHVSPMKSQLEDSIRKSQKELSGLIDEAAREVAELSGLSTNLSVGEPVQLGIFVDRPEAFANANLTKTIVEIGGERREYVMAAGFSIVNVRGKLIFLYVYSEYEAPSDLAWVRKTTERWIDDVLVKNSDR